MLSGIRNEFHEKWSHVGLILGLDNNTLENIDANTQLVQEKAFTMLKTWLKYDTESCYCKLISALTQEKLNSTAEKLKKDIEKT